MTDLVNHPPHYTEHPAFSMECHDLCRMMTFDAGNAAKYLWRVFAKGAPEENIRKALWYLDRVEMPHRIILRWDEKIEQKAITEAGQFIIRAADLPVQRAAVYAISCLVRGDAFAAADNARRALALLNEGATR